MRLTIGNRLTLRGSLFPMVLTPLHSLETVLNSLLRPVIKIISLSRYKMYHTMHTSGMIICLLVNYKNIIINQFIRNSIPAVAKLVPLTSINYVMIPLPYPFETSLSGWSMKSKFQRLENNLHLTSCVFLLCFSHRHEMPTGKFIDASNNSSVHFPNSLFEKES